MHVACFDQLANDSDGAPVCPICGDAWIERVAEQVATHTEQVDHIKEAEQEGRDFIDAAALDFFMHYVFALLRIITYGGESR